jgi:hypothetical protein
MDKVGWDRTVLKTQFAVRDVGEDATDLAVPALKSRHRSVSVILLKQINTACREL